MKKNKDYNNRNNSLIGYHWYFSSGVQSVFSTGLVNIAAVEQRL